MVNYSYKTILKDENFDGKGNISPSVVLDLFQKAASRHAEMLGAGYEDLLAKNMMWVLAQVRYGVSGSFTEGDELTVLTWPIRQSRIGFRREYGITSGKGGCIHGSSLWLIIDADTRKIVPVKDVFATEDEYCSDLNYMKICDRCGDFETDTEFAVVPGKEDVDGNGHINNIHYAEYIEKALGGFPGRISDFQIEYLREVHENETLSLSTLTENGITQVIGRENGEKMFTAKITY